MDTMPAPSRPAPPTYRLELTADEVETIRTALRLLESTLGHEEAEELRETQEIIRRLPVTSA